MRLAWAARQDWNVPLGMLAGGSCRCFICDISIGRGGRETSGGGGSLGRGRTGGHRSLWSRPCWDWGSCWSRRRSSEGRALVAKQRLIAVNFAEFPELGLKNAVDTGKSFKAIERPLPFAVPVFFATLIVLWMGQLYREINMFTHELTQ